MEINVLGTPYKIILADSAEDDYLERCDGYCDKTTRSIVVTKETKTNELGDFSAYQRKVMRHEIIHAFLFESGLHENWEHAVGHDEGYVDWIAVQFSKLQEAFEAAGCLG